MNNISNMAIPLFPIKLKNVDYVVLTTLLDKRYSTYDLMNKPNFRKIKRHIYLEKKQEMIASTGNLEFELMADDLPKKPLSERQWDRSFKKLKDLGIVEEVRNVNGKLYEYHVYNKSLEGKEYAVVETEIIRGLRRAFKSTAIKAYTFIRKECYNYKTKRFERKAIPLEYMCESIGLSPNTRNDLFKILQELHASKYIRIYEKSRRSTEGDYNIKYYEYEIVSYEDWKNARKPIRE